MKYQLIKPINEKYNTIEQILTNRNIPYEEINHYINTTDDDINSPLLLGEENLKNAAVALSIAVNFNQDAIVIIDSDCDGFTSSALLINYLYDLFPSWVSNHLKWLIHNGKEHGLNDCINYLLASSFKLILIPDASSNDYEYHKLLKNTGRNIIILDHHEAEYQSPNAIVINNQISDYPNKFLSGVGVTWQFCRYLDNLLHSNYSQNYLDLVALGNTADMMSLTNLETKHLINKGFLPENIKNPFIYYMWQKNNFKLGNYITSWGAAFYIAPFVNAMIRSGTQEEKNLLFNSMLNFIAFNEVPSTKRGHQVNETEIIVEQSIRTCINVKNRQSKAQDQNLAFFENLIKEQKLLDNKILLFLVEPTAVDKNIAGLIANKLMAKYSKPCCILIKNIDKETGEINYQGSARGCDKTGITNFKDICESTGETIFTAGHQGAFGLGIAADKIKIFLQKVNNILKDVNDETVYNVDYVFNSNNIIPMIILDIANMDNYWGKDIEEALVALEKIQITENMVTLMSPDKFPTLKITIPNKISLIKFGSSQEEYESFISTGIITANFVCKCNKNEWNGNIAPQLFIEDYEIINNQKYFF